MLGHHFVHPLAMRLGKLMGQRRRRRDRLHPPLAVLFSSDFRPAHQIRLTDDTDQLTGLVHHRKRAEVMLDQQLDGVVHAAVGLHRNDVLDHDIGSFHDTLLCLVRSEYVDEQHVQQARQHDRRGQGQHPGHQQIAHGRPLQARAVRCHGAGNAR